MSLFEKTKREISEEEEEDNKFLSQFSLELIHRVLLTEKDEFMNLTMDGLPRPESPSFEEFVNHYQFGSSSSRSSSSDMMAFAQEDVISVTMKKAYHDMVIQAMEDDHNYELLQSMILELHSSIQSIVPHRTDYHLQESSIRAIPKDNKEEAFVFVQQHLRKIGNLLTQLESPSRASSTHQFLQILSSPHYHNNRMALTHASFLVACTAYLHTKVEFCQSDIANFRLAQVVAPRIHLSGIQHERRHFSQQHPNNNNNTLLLYNHTRQWIRRTLQHHPYSKHILQTSGWVEQILFSPHSYVLPEIFYLDQTAIQHIRNVTRQSVMGSALALHAAATSNQQQQQLLQQPQSSTHPIAQCQTRLMHAMNNNLFSPDSNHNIKETFHHGIATVVIDLAKLMKPTITSVELESLQSRIRAVLEGTDPVLTLLNTRMRTVFCKQMMQFQTMEKTDGKKKNLGQSDFVKAGFAFYATDLASVAHQAAKIIHLLLQIHDKPLQQILSEEHSQIIQTNPSTVEPSDK